MKNKQSLLQKSNMQRIISDCVCVCVCDVEEEEDEEGAAAQLWENSYHV